MARTNRYSRSEQERGYSRSYSFTKQAKYVDGNAAPAYDEEPKRFDDRSLEFWHSGGRQAEAPVTSKVPANFQLAIRVIVYFFAVAFFVAFINITLAGATQSLAQESQQLQTSIDSAREAGKASEVQLGLLSNPTRIKEKAEELGMQADSNPITINLNNDNVVLDDAGNIALAGSLSSVSSG